MERPLLAGEAPRRTRAGGVAPLRCFSGVLLRLLDNERETSFSGDLLRLGLYEPRRLLGEGDLEREGSAGLEWGLLVRASGDLDLDLDCDLDWDRCGDSAGGERCEGDGDMLHSRRGFAVGEAPY